MKNTALAIILLSFNLFTSCKTTVNKQQTVAKKSLPEAEKFNLFVANLKNDPNLKVETDSINFNKKYYKKNTIILLETFYITQWKQVKEYKQFTKDSIIVYAYEPNGDLLGIAYQDKNGNTIKGIKLSYNENVILAYKNGKLDGISYIYKSNQRKLLIKKVLFKDDEIVWRETLKPNSKTEFHHCDFVNGEPYNGVEYEGMYSNDEMYYKNGILVKEIRYKTENGVATSIREEIYK